VLLVLLSQSIDTHVRMEPLFVTLLSSLLAHSLALSSYPSFLPLPFILDDSPILQIGRNRKSGWRDDVHRALPGPVNCRTSAKPSSHATPTRSTWRNTEMEYKLSRRPFNRRPFKVSKDLQAFKSPPLQIMPLLPVRSRVKTVAFFHPVRVSDQQ
jgi:hypothetical protein